MSEAPDRQAPEAQEPDDRVPDHAGPDLDRLERDLGEGSEADVTERSQN